MVQESTVCMMKSEVSQYAGIGAIVLAFGRVVVSGILQI